MRKIPLRVIFTSIIGLALLIVAIIFFRKLIINKNFVNEYNSGVYNLTQEEKLLKLNIVESYKPHYNLGNVCYKKGDYNAAITYYQDALKNHPTEKDECLIRINLALAMCNTIDFQRLDSDEKVQTALFILYKARDVLTEKGCASPNEGEKGHNADAQQLKEDIDKMIEKLENPDQQQQQQDQQQQQQQQQQDQDQDQGGGGDSKPSQKEENAQNELEKQREQAQEDRQQQQNEMDNWNQRNKNKNGGGGSGSDNENGGGGSEDGNGGGGQDGEGSGGGQKVRPW